MGISKKCKDKSFLENLGINLLVLLSIVVISFSSDEAYQYSIEKEFTPVISHTSKIIKESFFFYHNCISNRQSLPEQVRNPSPQTASVFFVVYGSIYFHFLRPSILSLTYFFHLTQHFLYFKRHIKFRALII